MARIPTYTAERGLDVGRAINLPAFDQSMGRAVEGLGEAIGSLNIGIGGRGGRRRAENTRPTGSRAGRVTAAVPVVGGDVSWFSKARAQTALDWAAPDSDLAKYDPYRQGVLKGAPNEAARQLYETWSRGFGEEMNDRAGIAADAKKFSQRTLDLTSALSTHIQLVEAFPEQYEASVIRALDDLEGARNWLGVDDELLLRRQTVTDLQWARAKTLAEAFPEQFEAEVRGEDDRYSMLASEQIAALYRQAESIVVEREERDDARLNTGDPEVDRQGFELVASGKFTPEWYGANYDSLSPRARRVVVRAINGDAPKTTHAPEELSLLDWAYQDGEQAILDAADSFAMGTLSQDAFARVYRAAQGSASLPSHVRMARSRVSKSNRPNQFAPDSEFARHLDTVKAFDDWLGKNPKAMPKEVTAFANELVADERKAMGASKVATLAWPRFLKAPDRSLVTLQDLEAAKADTIGALQKGLMTDGDAARAALVLKDWFSALGGTEG